MSGAAFAVSFLRRDFSKALAVPGVRWSVELLEWRAVGGPWRARLRAAAEPARLAGLAGLLRCPVQVNDQAGPAWWGYVAAVELHEGARVSRLDLEKMANKVSVSYRPPSTNPYGGTEVNTEWFEDAASIALYGEKERVFMEGPLLDEQAQYLANARVNQIGQPVRSGWAEVNEAQAGAYVLIEARGWWNTFEWKFFRDLRGNQGFTLGAAVQPVGIPNQIELRQHVIPALGGEFTCDSIWIRIKKVGAPGDYAVVSIYNPAYTVGASSLVAAGLLTDDFQWVRFKLNHPITFAGGGQYRLHVGRSGGVDAVNYYGVGVHEGLGYAAGDLYILNSAPAWVTRVPNADLAHYFTSQTNVIEEIKYLLSPAPYGVNQFSTYVNIEAVSSVPVPQFANGQERGRQALERMLLGGGDYGRRMLGKILPSRDVRIYYQPREEKPPAVLGTDGHIYSRAGRRLLPSEQPAGQWVQHGAILAGARAARLGLVFAERVTWQAGRLAVAAVV